MRRLLVHEAQVHAVPGRRLRDLGDCVLLSDPIDPEPFWNRLAAIRWPSDPDAFDRRLTEILVLFASLARQPHIWPAPMHDTPADLIARLTANGFRDMGPGFVMVLADPSRLDTSPPPSLPPGVTVERVADLHGSRAQERSRGDRRGPGRCVRHRRRTSGGGPGRDDGFAGPWLVHPLPGSLQGRPAAVARRATFDKVSYLSSIGTAGWARGRGLRTDRHSGGGP